jgi:hypothetical protein
MGTRVKERGQINIGRKRYYVTRLVLVEALGRPIAPGHFACHHCDNPPCVNPRHLYEGTPQSNSEDMHARGRAANLLGSKRPDVTARHLRAMHETLGLQGALLDSDDWAWFMREMESATRDAVRRLIERVGRGDGIQTTTEWLDEPTVRVEDPADRALIFWDRKAA